MKKKDTDGSSAQHAEGETDEGGQQSAFGFSRDAAGVVTLRMSQDDWNSLLLALGYATGSADRIGDKRRRYHWLAVLNRLCQGNPDFTPYEIPETYRTDAGTPTKGSPEKET